MLRIVFTVLVLSVMGAASSADTHYTALQRWQALNQNTIDAFQTGDWIASEAAARAALEHATKHLQDRPREVSESHYNLGVILVNQKRLREGREHHAKALEIRLGIEPRDLSLIAVSQASIANVDLDLGENRAAAEGQRQAVAYYDAAGLDPFFSLRILALAIDRLEDASQDELNEALDAILRAIELFHRDRQAQYPDLFAHDFRMAMHLASLTDRLVELRPYTEALVGLRSSASSVDARALGEARGLLARVHVAEGDYSAAESMFKQAVEALNEVEGGINSEMAEVSFFYGDMLKDQGRYDDAERIWLRTLDVERQVYGDANEKTIESYYRIGNLMIYNKQQVAAEGLLRRGLALSEEFFGPEHKQTADLADNLGMAISALGQSDEAIDLLRRALAIQEHVHGKGDAYTTATMNNLALVLGSAGQVEEALAIHRDVLEIRRKTFPPGDIGISVTLSNLAAELASQGTTPGSEEALGHLKEALQIARKVYPAEHEQLANVLDQMGLRARQLDRYDEATAYLREAAAIRSAPHNRASLAFNSSTFDSATTTLLTLSNDHTEEAFELAQWPMQTAASQAIAASAQRAASGDPALANALRQKQDLEARHTGLNAELLLSLGTDDEAKKARLNAALAETNLEIARVEADMAQRFPDFAQFQAGVPASVEEVSAVLAPDEALVFLRPGHERFSGEPLPGAVFIVRAGGRVTSAPLEDGYTLYRDARALLCSVHAGSADCPEVSAASQLTRGAFAPSYLADEWDGSRWYNLGLAHDLFVRMFGPIEDELRQAKRLIIVPGDEALASLPFQMLLSAPMPDGVETEAEAYGQAPWMIRDWALTVLPNVSALTHARRGQAGEPTSGRHRFLGVGDPVIGTATPFDCTDDTAPLQLASLDRGVQNVGTDTLWHGTDADSAIANVDAVRQLTRLPDTRCELERIAASLGGGTLLMEDMANEARLKAMSEDGELARFNVISFATHGLIAGEIDNAEPALVLTPPTQGTALDDGLLTAGEIAQLKLNAEWVLLSACNTAASQAADDGVTRAESFSGLARAFLYAGARNLLVSHWPVQSPAAVRLTTTTFDAMGQDPTLDRARAFQLSMLAILEEPNAKTETLHPRYWAPFTLLGGRS